MGFSIQTDHQIPEKLRKWKTKLINSGLYRRGGSQSKNEKIDKYLDLARELKNLQTMKLTVIPIVIGALAIVSKDLEKSLEELEIREKKSRLSKL